jgi:hypothetical protein
MHEWHLCLFVHLTHYLKMNLKLLKAGAVFTFGALLFSLVAFQKPPSEIELAKQWFEKTTPNPQYLNTAFVPDWKNAEKFVRKDGSEYVIVPLKDSDKFEYVSGEKSNEAHKNGETVLVLGKTGHTYAPTMLRIYASKEWVGSNGKAAVKQFKPHKIGKFSGVMMYNDVNGRPLAGLEFEDGKPVKTLTPQEPGSVGERECYYSPQHYYVQGVYQGTDYILVCNYSGPDTRIDAGTAGGGGVPCGGVCDGSYLIPVGGGTGSGQTGGDAEDATGGACTLDNKLRTHEKGPYTNETFWETHYGYLLFSAKLLDCKTGHRERSFRVRGDLVLTSYDILHESCSHAPNWKWWDYFATVNARVTWTNGDVETFDEGFCLGLDYL